MIRGRRSRDSGLLLGVDLGGSKVAVAAGGRDGAVWARRRRATDVAAEPRREVERIAADCREVLAEAGGSPSACEVVGVSAPGPFDVAGRRLREPPNLPGWHDVPLAEWLEEGLGVPVRLENDANAAALAEWRFGAGRGARHLVYLTMSTGVGAGLVLDGRLYRGAGLSAGEVGHTRVEWSGDAALCGCGRRGCLEAYVGGAAWTRHLRAHTPADSLVARLAGGCEHARPEHVVEAARARDAFARSEMDRFNTYLTRGIVNLVFTVAPERIVLGTIATAAGDALCLDPVRERVACEVWGEVRQRLEIVPAALGDELPYRAGLGVALEGLEGADASKPA